MRADLELWTRLWKNGTKGLIIAFVAFVASVVILSASIVYAIAARPDAFAPLENPSPQHVVNPVTKQGGYVEVKGTKCNRTDQDIGVEGRSFWRERSTNQLVPYRDGVGVRTPGCVEFDYLNPIPSNLPVGIWRLEGVDVTRNGTRVQQEPWYTGWFSVERAQDE